MRDLDVITLALVFVFVFVFVRVLATRLQRGSKSSHVNIESATQFTNNNNISNNNKYVDDEQRNETSRINILRL